MKFKVIVVTDADVKTAKRIRSECISSDLDEPEFCCMEAAKIIAEERYDKEEKEKEKQSSKA